MMQDRTLTILADGEAIAGPPHVRLTARYGQSLYPYPFFLRIWNAAETVYHRLRRAKNIQVMHGETILGAGDLVDVTREVVEEGSLITVTFAMGFHFWNSFVSLSVGAGATAGDTVRQLLTAAGSDMQLLTEPGNLTEGTVLLSDRRPDTRTVPLSGSRNAVFSRPQTFFGRLPEAIANVLSACGVSPYLVPAGIALMPADEPETETVLELDSVSGPWKMGEENVL